MEERVSLNSDVTSISFLPLKNASEASFSSEKFTKPNLSGSVIPIPGAFASLRPTEVIFPYFSNADFSCSSVVVAFKDLMNKFVKLFEVRCFFLSCSFLILLGNAIVTKSFSSSSSESAWPSSLVSLNYSIIFLASSSFSNATKA